MMYSVSSPRSKAHRNTGKQQGMISLPKSNMDEKEKKELLAEAKITLKKAMELLESDDLNEEMSLNEFIEKLEIPGLTLEKIQKTHWNH